MYRFSKLLTAQSALQQLSHSTIHTYIYALGREPGFWASDLPITRRPALSVFWYICNESIDIYLYSRWLRGEASKKKKNNKERKKQSLNHKTVIVRQSSNKYSQVTSSQKRKRQMYKEILNKVQVLKIWKKKKPKTKQNPKLE